MFSGELNNSCKYDTRGKSRKNNDTYYFDNKGVTILRFSSMRKSSPRHGGIPYRAVYDTVQDGMRVGGCVQPAQRLLDKGGAVVVYARSCKTSSKFFNSFAMSFSCMVKGG